MSAATDIRKLLFKTTADRAFFSESHRPPGQKHQGRMIEAAGCAIRQQALKEALAIVEENER